MNFQVKRCTSILGHCLCCIGEKLSIIKATYLNKEGWTTVRKLRKRLRKNVLIFQFTILPSRKLAWKKLRATPDSNSPTILNKPLYLLVPYSFWPSLFFGCV